MKKLISVITAAAAVAAISATAGAYSINKDLGFGWSTSATIGAEEFANVTPDTTVTITYDINESLADMDGQNYWCIKPMVNDAGWPFISTLNGAVLSEGGDSYTLEMDSDSMSFTIPADQLELLQTAGMAVMGHGIELLEMTFSDEPVAAPAETAAPSDSADNAGTPTEEPTAGETTCSLRQHRKRRICRNRRSHKGQSRHRRFLISRRRRACHPAGVLFTTRRK